MAINIKGKIQKPSFVHVSMGKIRLLIRFKLGRAMEVRIIALFWLITILVSGYIFESVRLKGAIFNLNQMHIQIMALMVMCYSGYKIFGMMVNDVYININPRQITISQSPISLIEKTEKLKSKNVVEIFVDYKDGTFSRSYIVSALMKNQNNIEILTTTNRRLATYLERRIIKHLREQEEKARLERKEKASQ